MLVRRLRPSQPAASWVLWAAESSLFAPPHGIALEQSALSLHTGRLDSGTGLEVKDKVLRTLLNCFEGPTASPGGDHGGACLFLLWRPAIEPALLLWL